MVMTIHRYTLILHIIQFFQERIQAEAPPLNTHIADVTIALISDVMQHSFNRSRHVTLLWDFLLLAHPAASTFVQHRPDQFYFRSSRQRAAANGKFDVLPSLSHDGKVNHLSVLYECVIVVAKVNFVRSESIQTSQPEATKETEPRRFFAPTRQTSDPTSTSPQIGRASCRERV